MLLEALCFPQRTQTLNKWPKGTVSSVARIVRDHASQARPGTGRVKTRHIMKPSGCGRGQKNKRQGTSELRGAPPGRIGSPQAARDTDQHVITATVTQRAQANITPLTPPSYMMLSGPGGATLGALLTPATPASSQLPCPRTGSRSLKGRMWPGDTINPQSSHVGGKRQTGNGFWASGMENLTQEMTAQTEGTALGRLTYSPGFRQPED